MYVRVTSFKVDPARLQELSAKVAEMAPRAKALPGIIDVYAAWRADGQGAVVAVYNSKADADAAAPKIQAIWGTLASLLQGAPATDAYDSVEHIVG
jgi:quinol monooxygenase YgiN